MKAIIMDDDYLQIELLNEMISSHPEIEVVIEASDVVKGLALIKEEEPQLVFLDVDMPCLSGIEVAERLTKFLKPPVIIFTTSYENYAVKAFDLNAVDYLVKPYSKERLYKAIDKARIRISKKNATSQMSMKIPVREADAITLLDIEDIYYIETAGRKTVLYTKNKAYEVKETLGSLEGRLSKDFIRCHKSYLVNYKKINKMEPMFNRTYIIKFKDVSYKVSVSRKYGKELLESLGIQ